MRFVITACGRSGTMFLSQALGRSRRVIVRHEHADDARGWFQRAGIYDRVGHLKLTRQRFVHDDYGEVNSCLRFIVQDLPVDKRGVLIRDPVQIALSSINKFPIRWFGMGGFAERCMALESDLRQVQHLIDAATPTFRFEQFTRDADRMAEIIDWLEIDDVDPLSIPYGTKVNASERTTCGAIAQLTGEQRGLLRRATKWFCDIHYPGTWNV